MNRAATRRDLLVVAVLCLLVGALLGTVGSVGATNGDNMVIGEKNTAITVTRLNTRGGLRIDNFKGGNTPLILNVKENSAAPFETNSTVKVTNLNADYLDSIDSSRLNSDYRGCRNTNADDGTDSFYYCEMPQTALETFDTNGLILLTGSAEVWPTSSDAVNCSIRVRDSLDGTWSEVSATGRAVQAEPPYATCTTTGWYIVPNGGEDLQFAFYVGGLETDTDVRKTASWLLFVPADGPYAEDNSLDADAPEPPG